MDKTYRRTLLVFFLAVMISFNAKSQLIITQWNFDSATYIPSTGTGVAENIGGTTTDWVAGLPGKAWNTKSYPAQGTNSGSGGVEYMVSTNGYTNISISWDNRFSNTAANRIRLQYTINGNDWIDFEASNENATNQRDDIERGFDDGRFVADTGSAWFKRSVNLDLISAVNNNPLFGVRLVTEFATNNSYQACLSGSNYSTAGTIRYDNVTVSGIKNTSNVISNINLLPVKISSYNNELLIETELPQEYEVSIYNLNSRLMATYSLKGIQKIRTNLPAGIYIARLCSGLGVTSLKFFSR